MKTYLALTETVGNSLVNRPREVERLCEFSETAMFE